MSYKIISEENLDRLEKRIEKEMKNGWELSGPIFEMEDMKNQSMVKKDAGKRRVFGGMMPCPASKKRRLPKIKDDFVNLTPHEVKLKEMPPFPSRGVARVSENNTIVAEGRGATGIPCVVKSYDKIEGLPEPQPGTWYIVSMVVFEKTDRIDVISPDSGETATRDEKGRIIAVSRFRVKG